MTHGKQCGILVILALATIILALTSCTKDLTEETMDHPAATPTAEPTDTPEPGPQQHITVGGYDLELAFCDEFDGSRLNEALWNYCPAWERQDLGNVWDRKQVAVSDGKLCLSMDYVDGRYKSGAIRTINTYKQQYGYFEIRCRLNQIPGMWCAFWLYSTGVSNANGSGEDGTEIDIFESAYYGSDMVGHAIHYDDDSWAGGNSIYSMTATTQTEGIYDGYHTFSLLWTPDKYVFYVDGQVTWKLSAQDIPGGICRVPLYLKVSVETGSWTGLPNQEDLPAAFMVDYVRTYTLVQD